MTRPPQHDSSDEDDQSRIRDLLRSLPDPGPMPGDVSDRILAALADEQAARPQPDKKVAALPLAGVARSASESDSDRSSAGAERKRSASKSTPRWLRPVAGLAAAAAVGAIAVAGYQSSRPDAPAAAAPSSVAASDVSEGVHVEKTGTDYSPNSLGVQADKLMRGPGSTVSPSDIADLGAVATQEGALKCAETIGTSLLDHPDRVTVDIATYNKKPAIIVVITKDGDSTAWALSRSCSAGQPPLGGPAKVTS